MRRVPKPNPSTYAVLDAAFNASQRPKPIQREGRLGDGAHRDTDEQQRAVVAGDAVRVQHAAAVAAMDEHPFAVAADGDGDGFHRRKAVRRPVARVVVDVPRPEAVWAMVPVRGAGGVRRDVEAALDAAERCGALVEQARPFRERAVRAVGSAGPPVGAVPLAGRSGSLAARVGAAQGDHLVEW